MLAKQTINHTHTAKAGLQPGTQQDLLQRSFAAQLYMCGTTQLHMTGCFTSAERCLTHASE
jgi:hypothetical protein